MRRITRHVFIAFLGISFSVAVAADVRSEDDYLSLLEERTGGCGSGYACCARQAFCLLQLFDDIKADAEEGRTSGIYKSSSINSLDMFTKVAFKASSKFDDPSCPANIRFAFFNFFQNYTPKFKPLTEAYRVNNDAMLELFVTIEDHIRTHGEEETGYLVCDSDVGVPDATHDDVGDRADYLMNMANLASQKSDLYALKVYAQALFDFSSKSGLPYRKVKAAMLLGSAHEGLGDHDTATIHYQNSLELATSLTAHRDAISALIELIPALSTRNDTERLLLARTKLAELYQQIDEPVLQAEQWVATAIVLNALERPETVDSLIRDAGDVFEKHGDWPKLAQTYIVSAARSADTFQYSKACEQAEFLEAFLTEKNLDAESALETIRSAARCDLPRRELDLMSLSMRTERLAQANDFHGAFLLAKERSEMAQEYRLAGEIEQAHLAAVLASTSWYALLSQEFPAAEAYARAAAEADNSQVWIKTNLAHSLLFQDRFTEAATVYLKHVDQPLAEGELWQDVIADDFEEFRRIGIDDKRFSDVLELMSK